MPGPFILMPDTIYHIPLFILKGSFHCKFLALFADIIPYLASNSHTKIYAVASLYTTILHFISLALLATYAFYRQSSKLTSFVFYFLEFIFRIINMLNKNGWFHLLFRASHFHHLAPISCKFPHAGWID